MFYIYTSKEFSICQKKLDYDIIDELEKDISTYKSQGNIIIAGDLNAKTGTERDYVEDKNDDHSPINDIHTYNCDMPIKQKNMNMHPVDS